MGHFNWQNSVGGQDFIVNDSCYMLQRYDVAKTIFACLYHVLKCLDAEQEAAVSSSVFVQISLHCTPPSKDSSGSCGALIISRNQAINLPLSLVVFLVGSPLLFLMMIIPL